LTNSSDEDELSDNDSALLSHIPGFSEELDLNVLRELTDVTNWRSIDVDIALMDDKVGKALAHLASQGKVVEKSNLCRMNSTFVDIT
jgi:hypothetical protein